MQKPKKIPAFIRNTYQMLERDNIEDIVSWSEDGRGFIIKQIDVFSQQILPQYFKHRKYSSFVRQLNMYGFHKQRQHLNHHYFVHEHFRKGVLEDIKNHITIQLKRKPEKKKKTQIKLRSQVLSQNQKQQGRSENSMEEQYSQQRSVSIVVDEENHIIKVNPKQRKYHQQIVNQKQVEESDMNNQSFQKQNESMSEGKEAREEITISQNQLLRSIHERIRNDVLSMKKIQLRQLAGDQQNEDERNMLVDSLIDLLRVKIEEGVNLINSSQTVPN